MNRILVLSIRAIGDMVLATPAIRALKEAFPAASFTVVCEKFSAEVFEASPRIAELIPIDRRALRGRPILEQLGMNLRWFRAVRRTPFDAAVDLFSGPRSAQMAFVSRAPVRVGESVRSRRFYYTRPVDVEHRGRHLVEQKMQIVAPLTGEVRIPAPEIFLRDEEREDAARVLARGPGGSGGPFAGLFPGAGWVHKMWPADRFAALGDRLAANGFRVVVIGGPMDADACRRVAGAMSPRPMVLSGLPRLRDAMAVIERMSVFVSNDTGPMHIAAALGCPTVGLFGPSDTDKYRPWGDHTRVVSARLSCAPCPQLRDTCHLHGRKAGECMERIPVDDVFAAAAALLDKTNPARRPVGEGP